MTSKEINAWIIALETRDPLPYSCWDDSGKVLPYIGWFWREVDFDGSSCRLGIMPAYNHRPWETNAVPRLGFMESNKWGYAEITLAGEHWQTLRALLDTAASSPEETLPAALAAIEAYLQGLLPAEEAPC